MRQAMFACLRDHGPMTLAQVSERTMIPVALLRSALTQEFFDQAEVDHIQHGRQTVWVQRASRVRVDHKGVYSLV